jgi:hypothetical protein
MNHLPVNIRRAYQELAGAAKYQHFIRIPDRIIQCIDYFGIACDRASARKRLHAYYLFIGVVDDAIDSGRIDAGRLILDYLSKPTPNFDEAARGSRVRLITEVLKCNIGEDSYRLMVNKLRTLYREVVCERGATSIDSYIDHRKHVGSLTAELSYVLIQPDLSGEHDVLLRFMKQVGEVGCLVDSLIDLKADHRLGLLMFKPSTMDGLKLVASTVQNGLGLLLRHPGLSRLFLQAVCDNIRDRFIWSRPENGHSIASDRKGAAASVA